MKRHIKINSGFIDVYYCKDFISLRDSNEDRFFLFELPDKYSYLSYAHYTYKINLGTQFAAFYPVGNKINYHYNGGTARKILNIKFTSLLKIIEKLTKEELENEKFKKIIMETE